MDRNSHQLQRTWKIFLCINDCLLSSAKYQTEISSRTHKEWDRAGRSNRFQHHTLCAILFYLLWIYNTMTPTLPYLCSIFSQKTHYNSFWSMKHSVISQKRYVDIVHGLSGLDYVSGITWTFLPTLTEPLRGSIKDLCLFILAVSSSTKPLHLLRSH